MSAPALLTPSDVRRLLDAHGLAPSKRLGQNFVVHANTVRKVVRDAGVQPGDLVVEVGPGLGSLTLALREAGARVIAVEVDAGMVRALAEVVGADPQVRLVHADALHLDLAEVLRDPPADPARRPPDDPAPAAAAPAPVPAAKLVANLPYNVATPLVLHALGAQVFTSLLVMVQREVGERWAARVGSSRYGAVSVKIAMLARARVTAGVPRTAFYPVPNVDSVTVALDPHPWCRPVPRPAVVAVVEQGFAQRRKRLRNALAAPGRPPAAVEQALAEAGLDPGARAEELDLDAWVALTAALAHTRPAVPAPPAEG